MLRNGITVGEYEKLCEKYMQKVTGDENFSATIAVEQDLPLKVIYGTPGTGKTYQAIQLSTGFPQNCLTINATNLVHNINNPEFVRVQNFINTNIHYIKTIFIDEAHRLDMDQLEYYIWLAMHNPNLSINLLLSSIGNCLQWPNRFPYSTLVPLEMAEVLMLCQMASRLKAEAQTEKLTNNNK